jgi:hypothetical protein
VDRALQLLALLSGRPMMRRHTSSQAVALAPDMQPDQTYTVDRVGLGPLEGKPGRSSFGALPSGACDTKASTRPSTRRWGPSG